MRSTLKYNRISIILAFLFIITSPGLAQLDYPSTRVESESKEYHGIYYTDKYAWLNDHDSEEVQEWAKVQDDFFKSYVKSVDSYSELHSNTSKLVQIQGRSELPATSRNHLFYLKNDSARSWKLLKQPLSGGPTKNLELPFNPRRAFFHFPSPDGKYVALGLASPGGNFDWQILDTDENELLEEKLTGTQMGKTRLTWNSEGTGFYYIGSTEDEDGKRSDLSIKYHAIGQTSEDKVVHKAVSEGSKFEISICKGGENLVVAERKGAATGCQLFYIDLKTEEKEYLYEDGEYSFIYLGNNLNDFYFETDLGAGKGRIVSTNIKGSKQEWKEVIPESKKAIMGYQSAGGTMLPVMTASRIVVPYQDDLKLTLKTFDFKGKELKEIEIPSGGLYFSTNGTNAISANQYSDGILFRFIGITEPNTVFEMDAKKGNLSSFLTAETNFDSKNYKSEIVFATSKDGTKVPITLTYKKGLKRDGKNYMMMQVYGAIAFTNYPYFQGDYIGWLEMGGIHAVAHIRGGGAYGDSWHKAGIAQNKQNGIDDYTASIRWVIENNYTKAKNIVINGVSAGTIPVAALLVQQPKLVGAAVLHYGMVDMLGYAEKYAEDQTHSYMLPEIGNPENKEDFEAIKKYSPYQNIDVKMKYPPTLFLTSENDAPLNTESYKMAALMQDISSSNPYLLQMGWGSFHSSFGSQKQHPSVTFADELAFLIKSMEIKVSDNFEFVGR